MLSQPIPLKEALNKAKAPVYGRAACGFPSPAEEYAEPPLSLDELCGVGKPSLFILVAWGHSMSDLGVYDGDYLVVDRAKEPRVGSVVVARIGAEFTVKTYGIQNGLPVLIPANPAFETIVIGEFEESECWGVVMWNLHKLHD
ncbi:DNA polymerase V [Pseudomonas simiae]|uniref:LexA family protein n=1 Tax=Pseudomonas simiae TaxID=321846 RepID=UPI000D040E53|nr:S24 family peptidase [Pseudomonas simiae]PRW84367.1 DNA polymerase V [Pseudomonas simiae]